MLQFMFLCALNFTAWELHFKYIYLYQQFIHSRYQASIWIIFCFTFSSWLLIFPHHFHFGLTFIIQPSFQMPISASELLFSYSTERSYTEWDSVFPFSHQAKTFMSSYKNDIWHMQLTLRKPTMSNLLWNQMFITIYNSPSMVPMTSVPLRFILRITLHLHLHLPSYLFFP